MELEEIKKQYQTKLPEYERAKTRIQSLLESIISQKKIVVHAITGRVKSVESYCEKASDEKYKNPLEEITDYIGFRIICYVQDDVEKIANIITKEFDIDEKNSIDKSKALGINKVGYRSKHFVAKMSTARLKLPEYDSLNNIVFEIQIRTLLEHTWAEIEHDRNYKFHGVLPEEIQRKLNLLSGVLEVVDGDFNNLSKEIDKYAKDIEKTPIENNDDIEITSLSLLKFLKDNYPEIIIEETKWKKNNANIIKELNAFGITILKQLNTLDIQNYIEYCKREGNIPLFPGCFRACMIVKDSDKYFEECWEHHFAAFNEAFVNYYKQNGVQIEEIMEKYKIAISPIRKKI